MTAKTEQAAGSASAPTQPIYKATKQLARRHAGFREGARSNQRIAG
jgi:hypothetical protein